jgi:hypothetical protein
MDPTPMDQNTIPYATPQPGRIRGWFIRRSSTSCQRMIGLAILAVAGAICRTQYQNDVQTLLIGEKVFAASLVLLAAEYVLSFFQ